MNFDLALCPLPVSGNAFVDAVLRELFAPADETTARGEEPRYRLINPEPGRQYAAEYLNGHRWIFLVRDLRDIVPHFARHLVKLGPPTVPAGYSLADSVEMVISHALPSVINALSLLDESTTGTSIHYEELRVDPQATIARALSKLEIDFAPARLSEAIALQRHHLDCDASPLTDRGFLDADTSQLFRIFLGARQLALGYRLDDLPPAPTPRQRRLSFFQAYRRPYYLWADSYRQSSAGIRSLHYLCHALNELGEEAYVTPAAALNPSLRTPRLTLDIVRRHYLAGREPIALYPEVVAGNPLAAPIVARWLLNRPGHIGGDTHFHGSDLIFHFARWCVPEGTQDTAILNLPTVDTAIFNNKENPRDSQRKGFCYYANKFLVAGGRIAPEIATSALSLGLETPRAAPELAEIFRQSEALLCYELSSMIPEALSCGCPVLIVPGDYWDEHGDPGILSTPGIALANEPEALDRVKREVAAFRCTDDSTADYYWWQVERFVSKTQRQTRSLLSMPRTPWHLPRAERQRHLAELGQLYAGKFAADCATEPASSVPATAPTPGKPAAEHLLAESLPSIELIVVATEPGRSLLAATLASLDAQAHPALTVTVIAPPSIIDVAAGGGRRCQPQPENHWLAAREVLATSTAQWAGLVRSGDNLAPGALAAFASRMIDPSSVEVLYSDTADSMVDGGPLLPHHLPAFDIDLVRAGDFPFGLMLARSERWHEAGGWRVAPTGLDTLDAALRLYERCGSAAIGHLPGTFLIRHRNNQPYLPSDPQIITLRRQIVAEHLVRCGVSGEVVAGLREELVHVRHPVAQPPKVSLIIPTKDNGAGLETCIRSVMEATDYPNLECLIIDNGTVEPSARAYLDNLTVSAPANFRVAAFAQPFNPGAIANAAAQLASGDLLLFLHDDVEALQPGWIHALVEQCLRPGIGIVGGRLLASNGTIAEAGIVPMQTGLAVSPLAGLAPDARVTASRLQTVHQVSAVSGACLMVRRDVFQQVGGMDAVNFPARAADIDFCLKVRAAGHRILWTPYATLLHDSDGTLRGNKHDGNALLAKWGSRLIDDPTFNACLALDGRHEAPEADPAFMPNPLARPDLPRVFATCTAGNAAAQHRLLAPLRNATEAGNVDGRWAGFLPVPVQLARLGTNHLHTLAPVTPHQLRELAACRQLLGCKVILELDGLLNADPEGALDRDDPFRRIRNCLRQTEAIVDRYVTGSAWLAAQLPSWAGRIAVIPDSLDPALWNLARAERRRGGKLRVGWRGTPADLATIAPAVIALAGEVDWVFIGGLPEALAACAGERHEAVPADQHPGKLANLDLDLAIHPLAMTPRNHCASHLPLLEYGRMGIPVIATNLPAHATGLPVRLTGNDPRAWAEAVLTYAQQPDMCRQHGEILRQQVLEHWLLPQQLPAWRQLWQE